MLLLLIIISLIVNDVQPARTYSFKKPKIINKEDASLEIGSNLNLTCEMHSNDTRKMNFELKWITLGKELTKSQKLSSLGDVWVTTLYLKNVSESDAGVYNCTLKLRKLAVFNDSVTLKVRPRERRNESRQPILSGIDNRRYISLKEMRNRDEIKRENNSQLFEVEKEKQENFNGNQQKTQQNTEIFTQWGELKHGDQKNLTLKENYARNDSRKNAEKQNGESQFLSPYPMFATSQISVKYGHTINVTCTVLANPEANVTFLYKQCILEANCNEEPSKMRILKENVTKIYRVVPPKNVAVTTYTVETIFNSTGVVFCLARNSYGEWKASQRVCITESPTGLSISQPIYEEKSVRFTCEMTTCKYSGTPQWYYKSNNTIIPIPDNLVEYTHGVSYMYAQVTIPNFTNGGVYVCCAQNRSGGIDTVQVTLSLMPANTSILISSAFAVSTIIAAGIMYAIITYYKKKQTLNDINEFQTIPQSKHNENFASIDKRWHIQKKQLLMGDLLGTGFFSKVYQAELERDGRLTDVAVKVARNKEHIKELTNEFKVMEHVISHPHIVNLLGAVVENLAQKEMYLIVEFCRYGCLHNYLKFNKQRFEDINVSIQNLSSDNDTRNSQQFLIESDVDYVQFERLPLNTATLLSWSYQISRGMEWLAYRNVLHGDLAARNILLTDNNIVKICDFGLARKLHHNQTYQKRDEATLPVKWMAIESLQDLKFSKQTDVWSFAVLLWELFTLGSTPYSDTVGFTSLLCNLLQGYRLQKPDLAPDQVYKLMQLCWDEDPDVRPTFSHLSQRLAGLLSLEQLEILEQLEGHYQKMKEIENQQENTSSDQLYENQSTYVNMSKGVITTEI